MQGQEIQPKWTGPPGSKPLAQQLSSILQGQLGQQYSQVPYQTAMGIYGGLLPGLFGGAATGGGTTPGISPTTQGIGGDLAGGGGLWETALGQLSGTLGGQYLDVANAPYVSDWLNYLRQRGQEAAEPGRQAIQGRFTMAGHQWSTPLLQEMSKYEQGVSRDIMGQEYGTLANLYEQERQRQAGLIPFGVQLPFEALGQYTQLGQQPLQQALQFLGLGGMQQPGYAPSPFMQILGAGAGLYGAGAFSGAGGGSVTGAGLTDVPISGGSYYPYGLA